MAQGVSLPAGSDKGCSPLTSAAFLKNCCTKKLSILRKNNFHEQSLLHIYIISVIIPTIQGLSDGTFYLFGGFYIFKK
jgi:hypothetical protein